MLSTMSGTPWRSLNLIGFSGTLAIAGSWGSAAYDPAQFLHVEPFLEMAGEFIRYNDAPVMAEAVEEKWGRA